jgi:hypothetical protein
VRLTCAAHASRVVAAGLALIVAVALVIGLDPAPAVGLAAHRAAVGPRASASTRSSTHTSPAAAASALRAPTGPPLALSPTSGIATETDEAASAQSAGVGDPLVDNGLGSPTCREQTGRGGLSAQALRNCRSSGFAPAPAPTSNYAFDVHLAGGLFELDPMALFQDYLLAPAWMGLVWVVHALLAMIEWGYTIDLIDSSTAGGLGRGLRQTQAVFTQPWLVFALAVASALAAYHGLMRRRVAATVGEVLIMGAMMVGGLWVIADPTGTVGALGGWANQASLGALSALAQGTPNGGTRTLTDGMGTVFADGIEAPWCYLEFGDVQWCREPAQMDPRLRAAGLRLVASKQAQAQGHSAELLRAAHSNGELFLALPANGHLRNSTAESSGLLRVLCGAADIGNCKGPTAAQAEFRGSGGTEQRAAGLLLILVGASGMVLLLGFLALRLLAAALGSLFYLLLAPVAVLAPAFGDGGREAFRLWATHLTGAVVSKLFYSLFLGAVLAMVRILLNLQELGWWPQWLIVSAAWWVAFLHRHWALGVAEWRYRRLAKEWLLERRIRR